MKVARQALHSFPRDQLGGTLEYDISRAAKGRTQLLCLRNSGLRLCTGAHHNTSLTCFSLQLSADWLGQHMQASADLVMQPTALV